MSESELELACRQVKIRGFRIEILEIEEALLEFDGVDQACVIVREDTPNDKRLVAYLVMNSQKHSIDGLPSPTSAAAPESKGDKKEDVVIGVANKNLANQLKRHLKDRVPEYEIPSAFVFVAAMPLTQNAKINRSILPAPTYSETRADDLQPPKTVCD